MNDKEINIALGKLFNGLELKGERVELGLIDDAKKQLEKFVKVRQEVTSDIDKAYTHIRTMEKAASQASGFVGSMSKHAQKLRQEEGKLEEMLDKARKAAKDLGIKLDIKDVIDMSKYNNTIKLSDGLQSDADLFIKFMKKLPKFNL